MSGSRLVWKILVAAAGVVTAGAMVTPVASAVAIAPAPGVTAPAPAGCHRTGPPGGPWVITCTPTRTPISSSSPLRPTSPIALPSAGGCWVSGAVGLAPCPPGTTRTTPGCHLWGPEGGPYLVSCVAGGKR